MKWYESKAKTEQKRIRLDIDQVVKLHGEGWSVPDIAKEVGVPEDTIRKALLRERRRAAMESEDE